MVKQTILFVTVVLAGCGSSNSVDKRQNVSPAATSTQRAEPLQQTSTPSWQNPAYQQKLMMELFPNAPARTRDADCFRSFKPDSSVYAIVSKCGRPDKELGSGVYIFVYDLPNGATISIGTPYLEKVGDIQLQDRTGKISSLLGERQ